MMGWASQTVESWSHFIGLCEASFFSTPSLGRLNNFLFRGQAQSRWFLRPSIKRPFSPKVSPRILLEAESQAEAEFSEQAHLHIDHTVLPPRKSHIGWWMTMQHCRASTRLLDWSASPFVAAYFAVVDDWDDDGAIWHFHIPSVFNEMKELYGDKVNVDTLGTQKYYLKVDSPPTLVIFSGKVKNERMVAQQGGFTMAGRIADDHDVILSVANDQFVKKNPRFLPFGQIVIPKEQKPAFLTQLRRMNVTANSLFPGADGLGRSTDELIKLIAAQSTDL